jgi:hypothetical protein
MFDKGWIMTLFEKIMAIYPELKPQDFLNTIRLQNDSDGKGDYIAKWEHPTLPRPTDDVLVENTNLTSLNRELA